jgi:outer membrane protein assembly complex protein YaeT
MMVQTRGAAGRWALGLAVLLGSGLWAAAQSSSPEGKVVAEVQPRNNRIVPSGTILAQVQTRAGRPYSQDTIQADVARLMGTRQFSRVTPLYQLTADDKVNVYFEVAEFPNIVQEIRYEGAKHLKDEELDTLTGLKRGVPLNPIANKLAVQAIERKYHEQGRLWAHVELVEGGQDGDTRVVFRITEGRVVKVKSVQFVGNHFVTGERLRVQTSISRTLFGIGGDFNPPQVEFDQTHLEEYYRTYGFQDVRVHHEKFFPDPDHVVIVYHIDEGPRYRVGKVSISGNQTMPDERVRSVVKLKEGDTYDRNIVQADIKNMKALYGNTGRLVTPREQVFQTGPGEVAVQYEIQERPPATVGQVIIIGNEVTKDRVIRRQVPLYPGQILTYPDLQQAEANLARLGIFESDPEKGQRPTVTVIDPDGDNPVKDILVQVQEAPTGSFLLGVGVNSDAGLSGSIVLNERNFDITRVPTSLDELLSGRAFRGAGQEFRLEAVPGTQFQRYTASFREPSLLDSPYSLGTSVYYYTRGYTEYSEQRVGTRVVVGRKLGQSWTITGTTRVEGVTLYDIPLFSPPDIAQFVGGHFLLGTRGAVTYDTRDSYLRPTEGMQVEAGFEQVFGDFTFPIGTIEGSKFWTLYQRPDGSGRQVLAARSQFMVEGTNAPVYERFYAGGFRSLRGFQFRGVGPFELGENVGGTFAFLNSLEYQVPVLASDKFYLVGFVDSGTVERRVEITNYRVTAGVGMRIQVPMLGPVPIALDFGFPIVKGPDDRQQIFSFWMGFFN